MTRKMLLIAGVAGLALTSPAAADKGGRGGDKPQQAAPAQDGEQQAQRAERPQRQERQQQRAERPQRQERQQAQRAERPQQAERHMQRQERPQRADRQPQRIERQERRVERQERRVERPQRAERQQRIERQERRAERPARIEREQRVERQDRRVERQQRIERQSQRETFRPHREARQQQRAERRVAERTLAPFRDENRTATRVDRRDFRPVVALNPVREMRQMKPFKTKFDRRAVSIGDRIGDRNFDSRSWSPVPTYVASRYVDTRDYYYRYDDDFGSVYRINRNDGYIRSQYPLFGGYGIGDPWPATYYSSYVPQGYQDYYYDTPDYYYRNDGYGIYQVDSSTQLITALVALLGGQGFGIGQALPASYDAYNVPLDYRDRYADSDDSWYRYGDGYIYQVDPGNRRIAARYPLYTDDYYVGEAWPSAYPDYNVPYSYQSTYYDTPQYQYRYADGGIYQVDPNNQVILALVALLSSDKFAVGQAMPAGYGMYNVPLDYRDRYADSDSQWYRYANGNVYQVDPRSGLIEEAYPIYT